MSAPSTASYSYPHAKSQRMVDGGYSGPVTVTAATGVEDPMVLVFVDADQLGSRLVLTPDQAAELAEALVVASREGRC